MEGEFIEEEIKYYVFIKNGHRHFAPQYLFAGATTVQWIFPISEPNARVFDEPEDGSGERKPSILGRIARVFGGGAGE
jgi:hypothetical protein